MMPSNALPPPFGNVLSCGILLLLGFLAANYLCYSKGGKGSGSYSKQISNSEHTFARQTYFYVGGQYENATKEQSVLNNGTVMKGQMYVESLEPLRVTQKWPIVLISGAGQTGANFLNTPDGRPGWASYFLHQGYHVYIVDQVARGRSAWLPSLVPSQQQLLIPTENYARRWTASQNVEPWPQAKHYSQWPGTTGLPGDPVFDQFYASHVPSLMSFKYSEVANQKAGLALLEKIGPAILLTHSQSALYAWGITEVAQPKGLVMAIIALEPIGPPFVNEYQSPSFENTKPYGLTNIPLTYDPHISSPSDLKTISVPPLASSDGALRSCTLQDPTQPEGRRKLAHFRHVPVLVVTAHASYHSTYDHCTVQFLKDAGVDVTWFNLAEMGIYGNGHFMFLEKNSNEIAQKVGQWLEARIKATSLALGVK